VDDLTGLPDRVGWEAILEVEEQRSRRHGGEHGLVLVKLMGPVDGGLVERAAGAIGTTVRDVDFVAVIDPRTLAVLALHCEDIPALVGRLRRAFAVADLPDAPLCDARPAGVDLRATWWAMADEHAAVASTPYVDFVAPAHLSPN
jgi:hypothetical protein